MKKIKMSSLPKSTNINDLSHVLASGDSGLVFSDRLVANLTADTLVQDANTMDLYCRVGLSIAPTNVSTLNRPSGTGNGLIIHLQRADKGIVTGSQVIWQIFIAPGSIYSRTALGDNTQINYSQWQLITMV